MAKPPYKEQLVSKQQQVLDQLKRIGKVELPMISPILGSEKQRNIAISLSLPVQINGGIPKKS